MAISFVDSNSVEGSSMGTMPTHQAGDILVMAAFRDGSNAVPGLPTGWNNITGLTGSNSSVIRLAYKVAASGSETSGTWNNATALTCHVYRGATGIGASVVAGASSSNATFGALNLDHVDGTSWVAAFVGHRSVNSSVATPPIGMTNREALEGANADMAGHDTNGPVSSWVGGVIATAETVSGVQTVCVEIKINHSISELTDNFNSGVVDPAVWTVGAGTGSISQGGGRLTVAHGVNASFPVVSSKRRYDLNGSSVIVEIPDYGDVSQIRHETQIELMHNDSNRVRFGAGNGNQLFAGRTQAGVQTGVGSITFNATDHRWLRIRESAGSVYFDTSPNGETWTNRFSTTVSFVLTDLAVRLMSSQWGTGPTGYGVFDNVNPLSLLANTSSFFRFFGRPRALPASTASRPFFTDSDWLWNPIPQNPTLDPDSASMAALLSTTAGGQSRIANTIDFGVTIVRPSNIDSGTPRHTIPFSMEPDWGAHPFGTDTVPVPDDVLIPPGSDGHVTIADPVNNRVYSIWQMVDTGSGWSGSWGGVASLSGDGRDFIGGATASGLSPYSAAISTDDISSGEINHALFFSSNMTAFSLFRYPAKATDGFNTSEVTHPIAEGTRVQIDPSIDLDAIPGITPFELMVGRALQTYGAYCGDKGGARMAFMCEYQVTLEPGNPFYDAGVEWDYWDMTHLPWSSLRVLKNWDGSA